jgi:hypothetical protein
MFDRHRHAEKTHAALEARFADVLNGGAEEGGQVVELPRRLPRC